MGVLPARAGTITFEGAEIGHLKTHERVRLGLGYVPQGHETFPQLTVAENLQVTLEAAPGGDRAALDEALDLFPALRGCSSGGPGFSPAAATAARDGAGTGDPASDAAARRADGGIQPSIIVEIEEAIARLHSEAGLAILLVEQYLDTALRLADRFVVLDAGEVVRAGPRAGLQDESLHALLSV